MENEIKSSALMADKNPKSEKQLFIDKLNTLLSEYGYPSNLNLNDIDDNRVLSRIRDYGIGKMLEQAKELQVAVVFADWIQTNNYKRTTRTDEISWYKDYENFTTQELLEKFKDEQ